MSLTRVDQTTTQQESSSVRRSSLVVNLSTTKKRSSVTTLLTSSNTSTSAGKHSISILNGSKSSPISPQSSLDVESTGFSSGRQGRVEVDEPTTNSGSDNKLAHDVYIESPQSAPPFLAKPSYSVATKTIISTSDDHPKYKKIQSTTITQTETNQRPSFQVIDVRELSQNESTLGSKHQKSSRQNSEENCPEPIVEVKHTSSSASSSEPSSDCDHSSENTSSTRLIRRRTVRRYQRATKEEEEEEEEQESNNKPLKKSTAELTVSISGAGGQQVKQEEEHKQEQEQEQVAQSHFRTRQIGAYYGSAAKQQQQQQTSTTSASSKIAKCSITTNRKSTTISSSSSSTSQKASEQVKATTGSTMINEQQTSLSPLRPSLDLRLNQQNRSSLIEPVIIADRSTVSESSRSIKVKEQEESSVRHQRQSFSTRSICDNGSTSSLREARSSASEAAALQVSSSRHLSSSGNIGIQTSADLSSTSSRQFKTSASLIMSGDETSSSTRTFHDEAEEFAATAESIFSSPHVRSLAKETWRDFAELENHALSSTSALTNRASSSSLSTRLFGRRLLSPIGAGPQYQAISNSSSGQNLFDDQKQDWPASSKYSSLYSPTGENEHIERSIGKIRSAKVDGELDKSSSSHKIQELMDKARIHASEQPQSDFKANYKVSYRKVAKKEEQDEVSEPTATQPAQTTQPTSEIKTESEKQIHKNCQAFMRIDQKMSDRCKELNECHDTKEAIDLLKIMIQMIEKAWSVPVCGDDLGFRLCNSLREAGGLDIIMGFVHDSENQGLLFQVEAEQSSQVEAAPSSVYPLKPQTLNQQSQVQLKKTNSANPLRLNLSKITQSVDDQMSSPSGAPQVKHPVVNRDSDSDILTSDFGLDSTSVESISYVSAPASASASGPVPDSNLAAAEKAKSSQIQPAAEVTEVKVESEVASDASKVKPNGTVDELDLDNDVALNVGLSNQEATVEENLQVDEHQDGNLEKEELVFLSARLLSQCLTSDNRDYIVNNGLDSVIKLACNFTTMKSIHSQRLLSRSKIIRQSSTVVSSGTKVLTQKQPETTVNQNQQSQDGQNILNQEKQSQSNSKQQMPKKQRTSTVQEPNLEDTQQPQPQQKAVLDSDTHAIIGTEILQHLFKHSEDTCSKMISLGGLQAILYGCRSSNTETLRHCASALANLALYGGSDSQQTMIEQKAHVWLFPLAFNEDDNVQYYACLAIVVLVANQEIEADVLKSSTLDLVEPFVTSHEPRKFAESTTSHIHGQSASWLRKLIPLLESKREEARNLACFHFAMEAYIKREQGQTEVFKSIGAVEPLRKVGSSPQAIASKFACQALRLIGEKEPHKLSQQVPLWTSEDVVEWVRQIGFERFKQAFVESRVDGDLLLQLDEDMLRTDIGIENGIIRKRFLRELSNLKRIADYSSVDKSGLCTLLLNSTFSSNSTSPPTASSSSSSAGANNDFVQYIYSMVQLGVTRDNIHLLDSEQLLRECKVANTIHRMKLALAIKDLQEKSALAAASNEISSQDGSDQKTLDVFVSYRRSTGSQLASLLKVHLQLRGFSVFIDVERLEAGKFDNNLLDSIKTAKNFILVLSPNALDRCIGDHECKDWVHKEIVAALVSNCNIIPIMDNFLWPEPEQLPEDMRSITYFNGVRWIHDYQDACVDKVERFIRGELYNGNLNGAQSNSSVTSGLQRGGQLTSACYSATTPSIVATPLISGPLFHSNSSTSGYSSRAPSSFEMSSLANEFHPLSFASFHPPYHSQTIPHQQQRRSEYDKTGR